MHAWNALPSQEGTRSRLKEGSNRPLPKLTKRRVDSSTLDTEALIAQLNTGAPFMAWLERVLDQNRTKRTNASGVVARQHSRRLRY